jgi:Cof subfamily protein (haloacid dehalogenase superfamily)
MAIRLLAVDIDGTLLDSRARLPDANRRAIAAVAARGVDVVLATGRRFAFARPVLELVPEAATIIANGGATIKRRDGLTLVRQPLARAVARRVLRAAEGFLPEIALVFDRPGPAEVVYADAARDDPRLQPYFERNRDAIAFVPHLDAALAEDLVQITAASSLARTRDLAATLARASLDGVELTFTDYPARDLSILDITAAGVSKGSALRHLATARGVSAGEVMAIGDNLNDRTMLEFAGVPVVMGNAPTELRRPGWRETASNDDAGVARAIEQLLLR